MYIFIGLGTPKNGFEKKFVTKFRVGYIYFDYSEENIFL
jgi:hypothetical protein